MKVLQACPYAIDVPGGVQVHVRQLAAALESRGHEVLVVAPAASVPTERPPVRIVGRAVRIPYGGTVAPICFSRRSFRRIRRLLDVFEPDVVHVHEPFSPSTSMLATMASSTPVVATFHAYADRSRLLELSAPVLRRVHGRLAASIAVSDAAAAYLGRAVAGEVEIVPNGVDVDRFAAEREPAAGLPPGRVVLWVNRLDPQKGFGVAVRAFAHLAGELDDVSLVVAGQGRERDAVGLLSERDRRRVVLLGSVPNEDLPAYHAGADVFVSPALDQESFGIVLVEAMAAGVPVVATDIPGYREVVRNEVDGILVRRNDPDALAAALRRVLEDPDLAAGLARGGRERAREFSWAAVAPRIEAVYRRVVGAGPRT
ncbi:MAG TPA: glycosyltransferase family 4 protein [Actinomycetota bacterium]